MADEISSFSSSANLSIVQTFRSDLRSGFDTEDSNESSRVLIQKIQTDIEQGLDPFVLVGRCVQATFSVEVLHYNK